MIEKKKDTIWTPLFIGIFIANSCQNFGQQMLNTLIPKYADSLGAAAALVGFVSSVFSVSAILIRPFSAPASDSLSKKKLVIFSMGLIFVSMVGYSFSTDVRMIIAFRLLQGIGKGICDPICLALASNSLPESRLASGLGIYSAGMAVAQAIGPTIGLNLCANFGYRVPFIVGAVLMAVAVVCAFFLQEPQEERLPFKISLSRIVAPRAVPIALLTTLVTVTYATWNSFLAIYGGAMGITQIGLYFTAYAVVLVFMRPVFGSLADRFGLTKIIYPALGFFALNTFLIARFRTLAGVIIAGIVGAFGYGALQPLLQTNCMQSVPRNQRGAAGNTNYLFTDFGMLLGPVIGGWAVDRMKTAGFDEVTCYSRMYLIMLIPIAVGAVYLFLVKGIINRNIELSAQENSN